MRRTRLLWHLAAGLLLIALLAGGCLQALDKPRPTALNPAETETAVMAAYEGTLTARAPTHTPQPTATPELATAVPQPTATRVPFMPNDGPFVAMVRIMPDNSENIILKSLSSETVLVRSLAGHSTIDLAWSPDGEWIIFTSAFNNLFSRSNELNIYGMRPDGTQLRMITGDYLNPVQAIGPFVVVSGSVVGGSESCLVSAQGVSNWVSADANGTYELSGVPIGSRWIRAVCEQEDGSLQGSVELNLAEDKANTVDITVKAEGEGWSMADLAPDGCTVAAVHYRWSKTEQGSIETINSGVLLNALGKRVAELQLPDNATLTDLAWSPDGSQIAGSLTFGNHAAIWLWDRNGDSIGSLVEAANPEDTLLSFYHLAWSPDGSKIVVAQQSYAWWSDPKFKTELLSVDVAAGIATMLVPAEYGTHALHPAWTPDGNTIYYQQASSAPADDPFKINAWQIWQVPAAGGAPTQVTESNSNTLPAIKSNNPPRTQAAEGCLDP